jgi:hypothetical protein
VDYISIDSTNLPGDSSLSDIIQVGPTRVLFEEWYKLRQLSIPTPSIAVWPAIPKGANVYQHYLEFYNNASWSSLVFRDPKTNKKVLHFIQLNHSIDVS